MQGVEQNILMNSILNSNVTLALLLIGMNQHLFRILYTHVANFNALICVFYVSISLEKGANCSYVEPTSSSSLLMQASLLGHESIVRALVPCLLVDESPTSPKLLKALSLGNDELITPLAAAVAEGNENVAMVRFV